MLSKCFSARRSQRAPAGLPCTSPADAEKAPGISFPVRIHDISGCIYYTIYFGKFPYHTVKYQKLKGDLSLQPEGQDKPALRECPLPGKGMERK